MNEGSETAASMPGLHVAMRTDVGLRRERNEDFLATRAFGLGVFAIVCDGMGGHRGGERASRVAVAAAVASLEQSSRAEAFDALRDAALNANDAVVVESAEHAEYAGMGTTLVAALIGPETATIANVGDSRAYMLRGDGRLERITKDHSLVAGMVERGEITEEEAERHPRRNVITRALGEPDVEPDLFVTALVPGDVLLLASDGLHGMIGADAIRDVLMHQRDPARACDQLVERALAAGGDDNISVIVARRAGASEPIETPTNPGTVEVRRRPRGLGLIIGVGLGAIAVFALLIIFFRGVMIGVEERARVARDTSGVYVKDSAANAWDTPSDSGGPDSARGGAAIPDSGSADTTGAFGDGGGLPDSSRLKRSANGR